MYLLDCIKGIYSNAFEGFEGEYINIYLSGDEIPELLVDSYGEKFSFGCDESKIHFNAGSDWSIYKAEDYIAKWIYSFAGYEDYEQMRRSLKDEITDKKGTTEPTDEEINAEIRRILIPYENRLRMMFGIDTVTEDDETSVVNIIIANNGEYVFGNDFTYPDFNITEPDIDFSDFPKTEPMPSIPENTDTNKSGTTENTDTNKSETTESTDTNKGETTENTDTDKGGTTESTDTDKDETTDNTYTESNGVSEDSNDENTNSSLSDSGESGEREETNQ